MMKQRIRTGLLILLGIMMFLPASVLGQVYLFSYFEGNGEDGLHLAYSHDGLKWTAFSNDKSFLTPLVGKDKLMRDPCIIFGPDSLFHMVWTSGWHDRYIGYASSPDLIHWSDQLQVDVMKDEPEAKNSWAPEIFYDAENDQYLIFWATTIPGRHSDIADSEREKGLNHRIYFTTTRDFKSFSPTEMFFNPDFSVIDATILEDHGKFLMFLKNENPNPPEKNIRVTSSAHAAGPYDINVSSPITGEYWAEGPTAIRIGKYVYVYFDKYREHKYGAVRSEDLVHWEDVSDEISFPPGARHGTVFEVSDKVFKNLEKHLE